MSIKTNNIEQYLKKASDTEGKRRYKRINVEVPVLYTFDTKGNKPEYLQCSSVDLSNTGIAIQIIDPTSSTMESLKKKNNKVLLKIKIPGSDEFTPFSGIIRWNSKKKYKKKDFMIIAGIEFDDIENDHRISILSYALKVNRRKNFTKLSITALIVLFFISAVWGYNIFTSKKAVEEELEISETTRIKLSRDIDELYEKKLSVEKTLSENAEKMKSQEELLKQRNEDMIRAKNNLDLIQKNLEKQNKILSEAKTALEKTMNLSRQLEERLFNYVVAAEKEMIFMDLTLDRRVFNSGSYMEANKLMSERKYNEAVKLYQAAIKEFPGSPWGYSGLARALYRSDKDGEAKTAFKKYMELMDRE
jgi:tetratricopeptide (TPR) repeat protein